MSKIMGVHIKAPVTNWIAYTPTIVGFGTPTSVGVFYRREGDLLRVRGSLVVGTPTAVPVTISLPSGLVIDYTKLSNAIFTHVGSTYRVDHTNSTWSQTSEGIWPVITDGSATGVVYLSRAATSGPACVKMNGNDSISAGDGVPFEFLVPITGWSSNDILRTADDTKV